jgi:hypothetical protein
MVIVNHRQARHGTLVPNLTPILPLPVLLPVGTSLVCVLTSLPAGSTSLLASSPFTVISL